MGSLSTCSTKPIPAERCPLREPRLLLASNLCKVERSRAPPGAVACLFVQGAATASSRSAIAATECPDTKASTCGRAAAIPPVSGTNPGAAFRGFTQMTR